MGVAASCLPAVRVVGLTRQARQIVTHQWNLITKPQVDACGCDRFGGCSILGKWCGVEGGGGVVGGQQDGVWRGSRGQG